MTSARTRVLTAVFAASLLSVSGLALVKHHEGLRFTAYPDPGTRGAPYTICYGHTRGVYKGMTATQAQCDRWLAEDIRIAEAAVQRAVRVPLTEGEYAAYTSFVFNAGVANFRSSTMLRLLNRGDRVGACKQLPRWIYANKQELQGLKVRRFSEMRLCLSFGRIVYDPAKH